MPADAVITLAKENHGMKALIVMPYGDDYSTNIELSRWFVSDGEDIPEDPDKFMRNLIMSYDIECNADEMNFGQATVFLLE